ncbi:probable protein phosphatase CG10417 [Anopheles darlingi]|uniref:probable protein phosphatase CG10417 n=1 Tax=Anopheles darlingi TaxID=43151 RepID=UPI0021000DD9|nr:probable protein phosphatase CG10417 [Anopheles darlingi]
MGAYLTTPITEKESSDESNEFLVAGSSSMQGWRMSQEDAHNCILDFDENVSFFAVYDGHGGAEVAKYCSLHLPNFLRTVAAYGEKNFEQALKDAFIGFDATLLEGSVIQELRVLSEKTESGEAYEEEEESDNVENLREEAIMPLYEVLQKYRKGGKPPATAAAAAAAAAATGSRPSGSSRGSSKTRLAEVMKEAGAGSKPISPLLKGKKATVADEDGDADGEATAGGSDGDGDVAASSAEAAPAAKEAGTKATEDASGDAAIDSTVSSSSNKAVEGRDDGAAAHQEPSSSSSSSAASAVRKEEQIDEISDTDGVIVDKSTASAVKDVKDTCAPDSSSSDPSKQQPAPAATSKVNGDVGKGPSASSAAAVSSSSSSSASSGGQENGVASSDCGGSKKAESVHSSSSSSSGGSGGGSGSSKAASATASPAAGVRRARVEAKNGPAKPSHVVDDDDSDDDDESDSDEEFPPVAEPTDTSSTEDGDEEEADNGEECSEEDEDVEEEYEEEEEEDYMNEEDEAFMRNISDEPGKDSGCTAVVALLHGKDLYVANAGDSRCVVSRKGEALEMSFDHKPEDTIEFERIEKAGGRVTLDGRVNGGLNLSRAIGDHGYKMNKSLPAEEQMISALPDIQKITIGPEDEFMVLACDGIWNFMTSEEVVQFVKERIRKPNVVLSEICEELFDNCLAPHTKGDGTGCDNMTAIIVQFKPNFTGAASRKRGASFTLGASTNSDVPASGSKKIKTDTTTGTVGEAAASSSTDGTSNGAAAVEATDETEAVAAVASIDTPMDTTASVAGSSEATSSSST